MRKLIEFEQINPNVKDCKCLDTILNDINLQILILSSATDMSLSSFISCINIILLCTK